MTELAQCLLGKQDLQTRSPTKRRTLWPSSQGSASQTGSQSKQQEHLAKESRLKTTPSHTLKSLLEPLVLIISVLLTNMQWNHTAYKYYTKHFYKHSLL